MTTKIKSKGDCYSGRDFGELAQGEGAEVKKVGSYLEIRTEKGEVYVQDCGRSMPKADREIITKWLELIGIGICLVVILVSLAAI